MKDNDHRLQGDDDCVDLLPVSSRRRLMAPNIPAACLYCESQFCSIDVAVL